MFQLQICGDGYVRSINENRLVSAAAPALRPTYGGIINQTLGSAVCRTGSSTWKTKTGNLPDDHRSKQGKLNGSSRILRLWDQSIPGKPPQGYVTGTEYTEEEIGWRAVYRREYTKMKMINVVTDKKICYNIYTMCKSKKGKEMEIKDEIKKLRESTGMNRKEFCEYFEIPYRTVTEWERGTRKMPDYVLRLLAYKVKMDNLIVKEDVNEE